MFFWYNFCVGQMDPVWAHKCFLIPSVQIKVQEFLYQNYTILLWPRSFVNVKCLWHRVLVLCTLYIQISLNTLVYNCVGVNLFSISKYKNSRLVFFNLKYCTLHQVDALVQSITKTWKIVVISSWKGIFHYFLWK